MIEELPRGETRQWNEKLIEGLMIEGDLFSESRMKDK